MFTAAMFKDFTGEGLKEEMLKKLNKISRKYSKAAEIDFVTKQLISIIEKNEKLDGNTVRQAALLDSLEKKSYFVNKLIKLGATFNREDIEEISIINPTAAVLLERLSGMRAKL